MTRDASREADLLNVVADDIEELLGRFERGETTHRIDPAEYLRAVSRRLEGKGSA